jgi:hypothetical protein
MDIARALRIDCDEQLVLLLKLFDFAPRDQDIRGTNRDTFDGISNPLPLAARRPTDAVQTDPLVNDAIEGLCLRDQLDHDLVDVLS